MPPKGYRKPRPVYKCVECGKDFIPKFPSIKQTYCSKKCRGKGLNRQRTVVSLLRVKKPRIPILSEGQKGYMAGIIDGDGSITLRYSKKTNKTTSTLIPWVMVVNTDTKILERISKITRIKFSERKLHRGHKGKKPLYLWQIQSIINVQSLLEQILPYLSGKNEQAQLLLKFISQKLSKRLGDGITKEEWSIFRQLKTGHKGFRR